MTFPLLVGLDGKEKMSKSLDNYIGITDSAFDKFKKVMTIPDDVLKQYFDLTTDLSTDEIDKIMSGDIREAHMLYAKELIKMYNDENEFEEAKNQYLNVAKGGIPDDIETQKIEENEINICDLLIKTGFASSKGEARRMIAGKGVKIDGNIVLDANEIIKIENGIILQFGKNKFKKVCKK